MKNINCAIDNYKYAKQAMQEIRSEIGLIEDSIMSVANIAYEAEEADGEHPEASEELDEMVLELLKVRDYLSKVTKKFERKATALA